MARIQHKFWLDTAKPLEKWLLDQVALMKRQRKYTAAVREGLAIWIEAQIGRVDTFERLFPGLVQVIVNKYAGEQQRKHTEEIQRLRADMALLQNRLEQMSLRNFSAVVDDYVGDEGDTEIVAVAVSADTAMANFMDTMFGFQQ